MKISAEQIEKERPFPDKLRSCYNCAHLFGVLSWWCGCAEAIEARGTQLPGCVHCPFWVPDSEAALQIDRNLTAEIDRGNYYLGIKIVN